MTVEVRVSVLKDLVVLKCIVLYLCSYSCSMLKPVVEEVSVYIPESIKYCVLCPKYQNVKILLNIVYFPGSFSY